MQSDLNIELKQVLPAMVLEIAALIGWSATFLLIKRFGGLVIKIPTGAGHSQIANQMRHLIGDAPTEKFMHYYGGENVYFPRCSKAIRYLQEQNFIQNVEDGMRSGQSYTKSVQLAAQANNFSERWGYVIMNRYYARQSEPQQAMLF